MTTSMGPRLSECTAGLLKEQIMGWITWITDVRDQRSGIRNLGAGGDDG
jgi:hypothetical protein